MALKKVHGLEEHFIEEPKLPRMSAQELGTFNDDMEKYREEKELTFGGEKKTVRLVNFHDAAIGFGAMRKIMHLGVPTYAVRLKPIDWDKFGNPSRYEYPSMMDRFSDKYDQWISWMGKKEFAAKKRDEWYEGIEGFGAIPEA